MHSSNVSAKSRLLSLTMLLLRLALATAFLSAVADRFGLWGAPGTHGVSWGDLAHFNAYVGKLNWFLPASIIPVVGWIATILETLLGFVLLFSWRIRWVSLASALLLLSFAGTMVIALGPKAPLEYSVFTAAAAAFLLFAVASPTSTGKSASA